MSSKKISGVKLQPSSKWNAASFHQFKDANGKGLRYAPCCAKAVKTFVFAASAPSALTMGEFVTEVTTDLVPERLSVLD